MKKFTLLFCSLLIVISLILPTSAGLLPQKRLSVVPVSADFDPLDENIIVTVTITEIRALKRIDLLSDPDFFVKVTINDEEFVSDVWKNTRYVQNPAWNASLQVPKDQEFVNITLELWDSNLGFNRLCDISPEFGTIHECRTAELTYSIATGVWWGDDSLGDLSGYGRLNGCDDNSIYEDDNDAEVWFTISQNDYDGDGLPYWLEENMYHTSPLLDNRGEDADGDGVPLEWEYTYGLTYFEWHHDAGYYSIYDPFVWENHSSFDEDTDGLTNVEEYQTSQWGSDPFRQDLFIEIDHMALGPNGEGSQLPTLTKELIRDSYAKHNIICHIDDGCFGGGEYIPFKDTIDDGDLDQWYWDYFMHNDANNWRRGIFHWGIIGYNSVWATGFTFGSQINGSFAIDCFYLSSAYMDSRAKNIPLIDSLIRKTFNKEKQRAMVYAGVIMHEIGHSLNMRAPGVDVQDGMWPWQVNYYRYGSYKSVMNYRYVYTDLVDYSDGSRGKNDYDDWATLDLTYFNPRTYW